MDNGRNVTLDAEAQGGAHGSYGQKGAETKTDSLWEIYVKEAESRDKSLMETWISAMDSVILFAGLFSASLTSFLVQTYQTLQPQSSDETAFYSQKSTMLLSQIAQQLVPGSAAISVLPSDLLPPSFSPARQSVYVNTLWFMSLVFSLTAALFATVLQQWARDYQQVFQRLDDPQKRARVRQYMNEGSRRWKMAFIVDFVPVLIHISLFLFFAGLSEFLFTINTTVATATTSVIGVSAVLYLATIVGPVAFPQFPYPSPAARLLWWLLQSEPLLLRVRKYFPHQGAPAVTVDAVMKDGRDQLAMSYDLARIQRDVNAIRWLLTNTAEVNELEALVRAIPQSTADMPNVWQLMSKVPFDSQPTRKSRFNTLFVHSFTENLGRIIHRSPTPPVHPHPRTRSLIGEISYRVAGLLATCTSSSSGLLSDNLRYKRARTCVHACYALLDVTKSEAFGIQDYSTMSEILAYLGQSTQRAPFSAQDPEWALRYLCMTMRVMCRVLRGSVVVSAARDVIDEVKEAFATKKADVAALEPVVTMLDDILPDSWNAAKAIQTAFSKTGGHSQATVRSVISNGKEDSLIELESRWNAIGWSANIDLAIAHLLRVIVRQSHDLIFCLPEAMGAHWVDDPRPKPAKTVSPLLESSPFSLQFIPPRFLLYRLWLAAWRLRSIGIENWDRPVDDLISEHALDAPELKDTALDHMMQHSAQPFTLQLWRIQDLADRGFVYLLELFFTALQKMDLQSLPKANQPLLETFESLTRRHKYFCNKPATRRAMAALLRRVLDQDSRIPQALAIEMAYITASLVQKQEDNPAAASDAEIKDITELIARYIREMASNPERDVAVSKLKQLLPALERRIRDNGREKQTAPAVSRFTTMKSLWTLGSSSRQADIKVES